MSGFPFSLTPTPPGSLKLKPGENGKLSFTLTSLAAPDKVYELELQPLVFDAEGKSKEVDWLAAGPPESLSMTGGKTETVTITVRPTATSPRGEHTIRLRVAKKDDTNEYYIDSPPVTCEVLAPEAEKKSGGKRRAWLIPVIIAGAVVVLGAGALVVWQLMKPKHGLGDPCDADGRCNDSLVCAAGVQQCLLAGGSRCEPDQAALCASGECKTSSEVCAIPIGGACNPEDGAATLCPLKSVCDPTSRTCVSKLPACTAGALRCTADGTGLDSCVDENWKTTPCPKATPACRDGKCQCVANMNQSCGQCGGKVQCDGSCSVSTPSNVGQPCGKCGGKFQCDGSCSISDTACQPPPLPGKVWRSTGTPCSGASCPAWQMLDNHPDGVRIASASGGRLYQLHAGGKIWRFTGAPCSGNSCPGWQMLDNNPATIGIFADGAALYQLHNSGRIFRYTGTPCTGNSCPGWQLLDNNPATVNLAASGGALYQLHNSGRIFRYTGTPCTGNSCPGWQLLDNNPATVNIVAGGSSLFQLHDSGRIWRYTGTPCSGNSCPGWQLLDNNPATAGIIAGGGQLYQLHNSGRIWQFTGTPCSNNSCPGWTMLDSNPASIGLVYDGTQLLQMHNSGLIWRYTGTPCSGNSCPGWQMLDNNPATGRIAAPHGTGGYKIHTTRTSISRARACYECR